MEPSIWQSAARRQMDAFGFTPTEQRVAWHLLSDKTNRMIGSALGITEHTVKQHLCVMYQKAQVSSRVGLVLTLLRIQPAA